MSTKLPADPPMERGVNPVRPAAAPTPRQPAAPPKSGFQRFVLLFLLLVIAVGGAYGTGYLVKANEMQLDRNDLLQQQLDAQERILALEQQIAALQENRENGNRVELDLSEVFDPIREAVGRIALVRMGEISREITTELSRLVKDDLPPLDDSADASGAAAPGGLNSGDAASEQAREPAEAASAAGEPTVLPQSEGGPDSLQPNSAAFDTAELPEQAIELAGNEPEAVEPPPASISSRVSESTAPDIPGLPVDSDEAVSEETSLSEAPAPPARASGIELTDRSTQPAPTGVAELVGALRPPGPGGSGPTTEP